MVKMYTKHLSVYMSLIIALCDVCLSKVKCVFFSIKSYIFTCLYVNNYVFNTT